MVILPGEGAVESFIERLAVLFVPFNSGLGHLRVRRKLEERGREREKLISMWMHYEFFHSDKIKNNRITA